jgi:hypothetical protein
MHPGKLHRTIHIPNYITTGIDRYAGVVPNATGVTEIYQPVSQL